ncbi:peroxidase-like [Daphnia carinata]|uniref:peroxidase-like n=1 Tax=Daphnia carinata TaxID=120202 RepID=UPI00257DA181|nr:peroxidase-like [Daphnia carinata]
MNWKEKLCVVLGIVSWFCCAVTGIVVPAQTSPPVPLRRPAPASRQCPPLINFPTQCRIMAQCSVWWAELVKSPQSICTNQAESPYWKACCPAIVGGRNRIGAMSEQSLESEILTVPNTELVRVSKFGQSEIGRIAGIESRLLEHKAFLSPGSTAFAYFVNMKPSDEAAPLGENGLMVTKSTQKIREVLRLSNEAAGIATQTLSVKDTPLASTCIPDPTCRPSKYRTIDGSCNNVKSPLMGRSNTQLGRYLAPDYDDGVWESRDKGMPNSRTVRTVLAPDHDRMQKDVTLMLMQFGQFVDHDITHVPVFQLANGSGISCCTPDGKHQSWELRHPHCFTLDILPDDTFYRQFRVECVNFVRSMVAPRSDCTFGYAEQLNQVTHWHDASAIYGSTQFQSDLLRERKGGRMKTFAYQNRQLLPLDWNNKDCIGFDKGLRCFLSGDSRVNQLIGLTVMQTVWHREHNRVAGELARVNPRWNDERLFQEARRVVIAELQHITYNEYLPVLLGRPVMEAYGLLPRTSGFFTGYNDTVNGNVFNEFSTAAYRYGHSMVSHWFELVDENGATYDRLHLKDWFNNPHPLLKADVLDGVLRGLTLANPEASDEHFVTDLTNMLFKTPESKHGGDLVAFNVWRGRDHGLPGYNAYRELFGLRKAKTFSELNDLFTPETIDKMASLYKSPEEIDLYLAGMSEKVDSSSGILGHTFLHMVADQFARLKEADRYFYETGDQSGSFTIDQLNEIRKTSLAMIFCLNSDGIKNIQPLTFRPLSEINPRLPCSAIPTISFAPWREP